MYRFGVFIAAVGGALIVAASASAHAELSPAVALAKAGQVFTLAVPTEKENAATTKIELTPPSGFAIDSFAPSPGWTRQVKSTVFLCGSTLYTYWLSRTIRTLAKFPVPHSFTEITGGSEVVNSSPMKWLPERTSARILSVAP